MNEKSLSLTFCPPQVHKYILMYVYVTVIMKFEQNFANFHFVLVTTFVPYSTFKWLMMLSNVINSYVGERSITGKNINNT